MHDDRGPRGNPLHLFRAPSSAFRCPRPRIVVTAPRDLPRALDVFDVLYQMEDGALRPYVKADAA
jgi:hypothetical protein